MSSVASRQLSVLTTDDWQLTNARHRSFQHKLAKLSCAVRGAVRRAKVAHLDAQAVDARRQAGRQRDPMFVGHTLAGPPAPGRVEAALRQSDTGRYHLPVRVEYLHLGEER